MCLLACPADTVSPAGSPVFQIGTSQPWRPGETGRETDLFTYGWLCAKMEFFNEKGEKVYLVVDDGRGYYWLNEVGE